MAIKSVISLKDNFTAVMRTAKRETSSFAKEIQSTKKAIEKLQSQKKEIQIKAKMDNINKNIQIVKTKLDSLKKSFVIRIKTKLENTRAYNKIVNNPKVVLIKTKFQDSKIIQKIKSIEGKVKKLDIKKTINIAMAYKEIGKEKFSKIKNKVQTIAIKAKDIASPVISKIKSGLGTLGSFAKKAGAGIGIALLAGLGTGIHGSLALEQQKVAMNHFIGTQNKGMSKDQVSKTSDDYVKWLRGNANKTPFETGEVIGAGSRAVNVAGGNVDQAKGLVQLAENMAALNPGKSVMDAMEALADLKLGEAERMKEFGFKLSANDFTGGKGQMSDMKPEQFAKAYDNIVKTKLNPFFDSGAEKIAQTRQGQLSTIVGVGKSILTDVSTKLLQKDGGTLGKMADYMSNNADSIVLKMSSAMDKVFNVIGIGWNYLVQGFKTVKPYLMPIADFLQTGISDRISFIGTLITQWKPVFMNIWNMLTSSFTRLWPVISGLFTNAWNLIKSIITVISPIMAQVVNTLISWVTGYIVPFWAQIGGFVSGLISMVGVALNIVSPLLAGLGTGAFKALQGILDFISGIFTGNWKKAWDGVLNIFNGIWSTITGAVKSIGNAINFITGGDKKPKSPTPTTGGTPYTPYTGGTTKWTPHAVGLNRVPRDNYPAMLHQGERVLTAQEVRQGKGDNGNLNLEMLISRIVGLIGKTGKEVRVEIAKIADSIIIREEADIYKIADAIAEKLEGIAPNLT